MFDVFFTNSNGKSRRIGSCEKDQIMDLIKQFLEDRNYVCHYVRMYENKGTTYFDVGSHTEHFFVPGKVLNI